MLDSAFVLQSSVTFENMLLEADFSLVNPPRLVHLRSRQTINIDVDTGALQQIEMFVTVDRTTGEESPFVNRAEPRFIRGQNISSSVAFAFLAQWFEWDDQQVFLSDPDDVAAVERILAEGFAQMQLTNRTIEGPVTLGPLLNRMSQGQQFSEINAAANDAMANTVRPLKYGLYATPRVVEPQTELTPDIFFNGSDFATFGVAAGSDFKLVWEIIALIGDIKG